MADSNIGLTYNGMRNITSTLAKGQVARVAHCFKLDGWAQRESAPGAGPSPCDARSPVSPCCSQEIKGLASLTISASASCKPASKSLRWSYNGRPVRALAGLSKKQKSAANASSSPAAPPGAFFKLSKLSVANGTGLLCVMMPAGGAGPGCASIQELCGGTACLAKAVTAPFAVSDAAGGAAVSCCLNNGTVLLDCGPGTGTEDGYTCRDCPQGSYRQGGSSGPSANGTSGDGMSALATCQQCPDGYTTSGSKAQECDLCADGWGGDGQGACTLCPAGAAGKGLKPTEPCALCNGVAQYSDQPGSAECKACSEGSSPNSNHTQCQDSTPAGSACIDGHGGYDGACAPCPAGTAGKGLTSGDPCPPCAGDLQYTDAPGSAECKTCGGGSAANGPHTGCDCSPTCRNGGECQPDTNTCDCSGTGYGGSVCSVLLGSGSASVELLWSGAAISQSWSENNAVIRSAVLRSLPVNLDPSNVAVQTTVLARTRRLAQHPSPRGGAAGAAAFGASGGGGGGGGGARALQGTAQDLLAVIVLKEAPGARRELLAALVSSPWFLREVASFLPQSGAGDSAICLSEGGQCVDAEGGQPVVGSSSGDTGCSFRGVLQNGSCACSEGFAGSTCRYLVVPGVSMNGTAIATLSPVACPDIDCCADNCTAAASCAAFVWQGGACTLMSGAAGSPQAWPQGGSYAGVPLNPLACPEGAVCCLNGGQLTVTGGCNCSGTGYFGETCQIQDCSPACDHGTCISARTCDCAGTGYSGDTCSNKDCAPACEHGGVCTANGTCDCSGTGYSGSTCSTPVPPAPAKCEPACANGGECVADGVCNCTASRHTGPTCETPVCDPACQHGGECVEPGVCNCTATNYTGDTCSEPVCSPACANNGTCTAPDTCDCTGTGYSGSTCAAPVCSPACANNGTCVAPDTCNCTGTGYSGSTCAVPVCNNACGHGGACVGPDTCDCSKTGYGGKACQDPVCNPTCKHGGVCSSNNTCDCANTQYTGVDCSQPVCSPACANHGTCTAPDTCDCTGTGYSGSTCAVPVCSQGCANNGTCIAPDICDCTGTAGWCGRTCAVPVCSPACAHNGNCTAPGICDCTGTGYIGSTCAVPVCSSACANNGTCVAPDTCNCTGTGYNGSTCSTPVCSPPCQNGGVCSAPNTCNCTGTYHEGATCSIPINYRCQVVVKLHPGFGVLFDPSYPYMFFSELMLYDQGGALMPASSLTLSMVDQLNATTGPDKCFNGVIEDFNALGCVATGYNAQLIVDYYCPQGLTSLSSVKFYNNLGGYPAYARRFWGAYFVAADGTTDAVYTFRAFSTADVAIYNATLSRDAGGALGCPTNSSATETCWGFCWSKCSGSLVRSRNTGCVCV